MLTPEYCHSIRYLGNDRYEKECHQLIPKYDEKETLLRMTSQHSALRDVRVIREDPEIEEKGI